MKLLLTDDDTQDQVNDMYKILKQNHPDVIDGIPEHCVNIVIANYIYSNKEEEDQWVEKMSSIKVKEEECDLPSDS